MDLVVARTRKERKALKYGEVFLKLFGLTLTDLVDFRKILYENQTLADANKRLYKENQQLKGNQNKDEEHEKGTDADLVQYLSEK